MAASPLILSTATTTSLSANISARSSIGFPSFRLSFFRSALRRFLDDLLQTHGRLMRSRLVLWDLWKWAGLTRRCGSCCGSTWSRWRRCWPLSRARRRRSRAHLHLRGSTLIVTVIMSLHPKNLLRMPIGWATFRLIWTGLLFVLLMILPFQMLLSSSLHFQVFFPSFLLKCSFLPTNHD